MEARKLPFLDAGREGREVVVGDPAERDPLRGLDGGALRGEQTSQGFLGLAAREIALRGPAALGPGLGQNLGRVLARNPVAADPYRVPPPPVFVLGGQPHRGALLSHGKALLSTREAYQSGEPLGSLRAEPRNEKPKKPASLQPFPDGPGRTRTCARRIMSPLRLAISSNQRPTNAGEMPLDHVRFPQLGTRGYPPRRQRDPPRAMAL